MISEERLRELWVAHGYKSAMSLAFARAVEAEAYEAAAKVCDEGMTIEAMDGEHGNAAMVRALDRQAELLAAAIRALIPAASPDDRP